MWGYYWGYTCAQIELMAMDQPVVVYDKVKDKGGKKGKKKTDENFSKPSALQVLRAQQKWQESHAKNEGKPIVINFGGESKPIKQE